MEIAPLFILHLALFRLSLVATGVISIVLGYRLFAAGLGPYGDSKDAALEAKLAGASFSLKNAAPGTFFALFGVIIISSMLLKAPPAMSLDDLKRPGAHGEGGKAADEGTHLQLRGDRPAAAEGGPGETLHSLLRKGEQREKERDIKGAITAYREAAGLVAAPLNHLAWLYQEQGDLEGSLPLALLAVQLDAGNADFQDTLAEILWKSGKRKEALLAIDRAAALDPAQYKKKAEELRSLR